jgi:single-strand DNA-binding protein
MRNHIEITGNVGNSEVRFTQSGMAVLNFSVAVNIGKKLSDGTYDNKTMWMNCTAFKDLAENAADEVVKGKYVQVAGRLDEQEYTGKDGAQHKAMKIIADEIAFPVKPWKQKQSNGFDNMGNPANDEEIPF